MQAVRAYHNNHEASESNTDAGDALAASHHALPLKTPTRTTTFNTTLLRTNLKENALRTTATLKKSVHASAAGLKRHAVYPSTPGLRQSQAGAGHLLLKDNAVAGVAFTTNTSIMPPLLDLTNKTPFTTRIHHDSPADAMSLPLKMPFLDPSISTLSGLDASPETIIRPSRSRFSLRTPRLSSSQVKLGQGSNDPSSFQTPDPLGRRNQWDISHGDISVSVIGPDVEAESASECDDEIEYMPPPVAELPYDPGFPMPDYKQLGAELWKLGNVLDLTTLLPYHPPAHLQEFKSDDMVTDAIASLSLSLEALHEELKDNDDVFLPYKRRQEYLRTNGRKMTTVPGTKATVKDTKRTASGASKSTRSSSSAFTSPTSPSHLITKPMRAMSGTRTTGTAPKIIAKDAQAKAAVLAPLVSESTDVQLKEQASTSRLAKAMTAPPASTQMQTTRIATRSSSRARNGASARIVTGSSASASTSGPASGSGPDSSGSKIPSVRRPVRSTPLNTATRVPPERRTRSATAPKPQHTAPIRPVPASGTIRTRAQAAMAAQEPAPAPGPTSVRKRTTSSTSSKAVPTRSNNRALASLAAMRESQDLPENKEFDDDDDEVMPELMLPQTAYLDLLTGGDFELLA